MKFLWAILPHFAAYHLYFNGKWRIIYVQNYTNDAFLHLPIEIVPKIYVHQIVRSFCMFGFMYVYATIYHEEWQ